MVDVENSPKPLTLVLSADHINEAIIRQDLITDLHKPNEVILLPAQPNFSPFDLAQFLARHAQIALTGSPSSREQLDQVFYQCKQAQKTYVVAITDAHQLPVATLAAISHLVHLSNSGNIFLYWLLIGNDDLLAILRSIQNKEIPFVRLQPASIKPTISPTIEQPTVARPVGHKLQQHRVKSISLLGLLLIGALLWYHKKHDYNLSPKPPVIINQSANDAPVSTPTMITAPTPTPAPVAAPAPTPISQPVTVKTATKPPTLHVSKNKISSPAYILQLMASHDHAALQQFIHHYRLENTARIIRTRSHGQSWYAVAYGQFATQQQADQARLHLPLALKKLHPWIKKL
jgi:hypothetical protein